MTETDVEDVARLIIERHGKGASLLAYQQITRTMRKRNRAAAEEWCRVLLEVESLINQA